jgi:hypothetical protein
MQRRYIMRVITPKEMELVSGGVDRKHDLVPNAQSEHGRFVNDMANMLGRWGDFIGSKVFDWTH